MAGPRWYGLQQERPTLPPPQAPTNTTRATATLYATLSGTPEPHTHAARPNTGAVRPQFASRCSMTGSRLATFLCPAHLLKGRGCGGGGSVGGWDGVGSLWGGGREEEV